MSDETSTTPAQSDDTEQLKKILMHTKVTVYAQGKEFFVNLGTVISYGDNWQRIMAAIQAQLDAAYQRGRIDEAKTCEEEKRHG